MQDNPELIEGQAAVPALFLYTRYLLHKNMTDKLSDRLRHLDAGQFWVIGNRISGHSTEIVTAFAQRDPEPLRQAALSQKENRITSYNVCYTKLLRRRRISPAHGRRA